MERGEKHRCHGGALVGILPLVVEPGIAKRGSDVFEKKNEYRDI